MSEIAFPVRSSLAIASAVLLCAGFVAGADCNGNDIDDADDIESGTSSDCNADGVPDECELAPIGFEVTEMSAVLPRTLRVVRTADLDDDGDLDLVAASGPAAATVIYRLENDGGRALIQAQELELAGRTHDLETGDLDGDGRLDVVATTGSTLYLLTNDGTVFRVSAEIALADEEARDVALADIDGDGHTDLVSPVYRAAAVSVRFGDGNGSLGPPLRYTLEADVDAVVPADLDGDARPDLAVLHRTAAAVSTLLNDGSGGFLAPVSHPIDIRANALLAADLDGDLRSELIGPGFILRATGETPGEVTRFEERVTTVTLGEVVVLPAASRAVAVTTCEPLVVVVVFHGSV